MNWYHFFQDQRVKCIISWHILTLKILKKICSRFRLDEKDEQIEVRWKSTLDVKRCQVNLGCFFTMISKKRSQSIWMHISRVYHFHSEIVHLIIISNKNNIILSKISLIKKYFFSGHFPPLNQQEICKKNKKFLNKKKDENSKK